MTKVIGRGRYATETYPRRTSGGGSSAEGIKRAGWASPEATVNYDFNYNDDLLVAPAGAPVTLTLPLAGIVAGDVIEYAWDLYVDNTGGDNPGLATTWGQAQWDGSGDLYTLNGSLGTLVQTADNPGPRFNMHGRWAYQLTADDLAGHTTLVITPQFSCVPTLNVPVQDLDSGIDLSNQFRVIVYAAASVFQVNPNNTLVLVEPP